MCRAHSKLLLSTLNHAARIDLIVQIIHVAGRGHKGKQLPGYMGGALKLAAFILHGRALEVGTTTELIAISLFHDRRPRRVHGRQAFERRAIKASRIVNRTYGRRQGSV